MELHEVIYSQGFGTRRVCAGLIQQGHVELPLVLGEIGSAGKWQLCVEPHLQVAEDVRFLRIQGKVWEIFAKAYLMLHKPMGTECSQKPSTYPSIYTLLPAPLRQRPAKTGLDGVQAVGRLDQDTTGLLLLSDDGKFIHQMASPKKRLPKVYEVSTKHAVDSSTVEALLNGVALDDDVRPVRAAACEIVPISAGEPIQSHRIRLTLTQGKYHQVKRMLAAVGNRVEALHRSRIGALDLPPDLAPGEWRWLSPADLDKLRPISNT